MITNIMSEIHWWIQNKKGMNVYYPLLYSLIVSLNVKRAFEFGIGFSTKVILEALTETDGSLTSCDLRGERALKPTWKITVKSSKGETMYTDISKEIKLEESHKNRWVCLPLSSTSALKMVVPETKVVGKFDFVLHDGAHDAPTIKSDLESIVPLINVGGFLVVHDTCHPSYDLGEIFGVRKVNINRDHNNITLPNYMGLTIVEML